ncbi:hypothetical protein BH24ACT1_BH24ACT1_09210 [soil metagenome]
MGFMRTAMAAGIAKRVWNEVRKPQNQAKAKALFNKVRAKGEGQSRSEGSPRR